MSSTEDTKSASRKFDLSLTPEADAALDKLLAEYAARGINLSKAGVIRASLVQQASGINLLVPR
jgi:hypothetical protein